MYLPGQSQILTSNKLYKPPKLLAKQSNNESQKPLKDLSPSFGNELLNSSPLFFYHTGGKMVMFQKRQAFKLDLSLKEKELSGMQFQWVRREYITLTQRMCSQKMLFTQKLAKTKICL